MSKPKIDWSKHPHAGLDNDAMWLKCENSTLRNRIKELEAEVARLREALENIAANHYWDSSPHDISIARAALEVEP